MGAFGKLPDVFGYLPINPEHYHSPLCKRNKKSAVAHFGSTRANVCELRIEPHQITSEHITSSLRIKSGHFGSLSVNFGSSLSRYTEHILETSKSLRFITILSSVISDIFRSILHWWTLDKSSDHFWTSFIVHFGSTRMTA